jgi:hypothetical protein
LQRRQGKPQPVGRRVRWAIGVGKWMMLRSMVARAISESRWSKSLVCFAFAQTRFPLGQVSHFRTG